MKRSKVFTLENVDYYLDLVYLEYEQPELFSVTNAVGASFLVLLTNADELAWLMSPISTKKLRKMEYGTHNGEVIEKLNRLTELEDKIEQGRLIELPCKVGDTVYCVYAVSGIQEWEVMSIAIYDHDIVLRLGHKGTNDYNAAWLKEKGTYLFFTPEEAEKRLKELQE